MDGATLLLGAIAVATVVMAAVQVALIVVALRTARQLQGVLKTIEAEIAPTLERVNTISGDVTKATTLAAAQVTRADRLFGTVAERVDRVTLVVQDAVIEPLRQGVAVWQGVCAGVGAVAGSWAARREPDRGSGSGAVGQPDDEEALFIG